MRPAAGSAKPVSTGMVNTGETIARGGASPPTHRLALSCAPPDRRQGLTALLALDGRFAAVVRSTTEPLIGQMRLTWWREALLALDNAPPPDEPLLGALVDHVLPHGVSEALLATQANGWETLLLADPLAAPAMLAYADSRGGGLFEAAAALLGAPEIDVRGAGAGWALADLAGHLTSAAEAAVARDLARSHLGRAANRWPRKLRALGVLVLFARMDVAASVPGAWMRAGRLLRFQLTGR